MAAYGMELIKIPERSPGKRLDFQDSSSQLDTAPRGSSGDEKKWTAESTPIRHQLKSCTWIGRLWIVYVFKSGRAFVLGPHWPFSFVMLLIHVGVGWGLVTFTYLHLPLFPHTCLLVCLIFCSILLFLLTVFSDPGILLRGYDHTRENNVSDGNTDELTFCVGNTHGTTGNVTKRGDIPYLKPWITSKHTGEHVFIQPQTRPRKLSTSSGSSSGSTHGYDVFYEDVQNETLFPQAHEDGGTCALSSTSSNLTSDTRRVHLWCRWCELSIPRKTRHCLDCKVCIRGYDHHCPWTSKCIGVGNIHYFYCWLGSILLAFVYFTVVMSVWASKEDDAEASGPTSYSTRATMSTKHFLYGSLLSQTPY